MTTPFRILSLDGGGAKGFYTLGVLAEVEALTGGRPLSESFDLIFGTSTGAIIAALLARGESVASVRALYEKHVPAIMGKRLRSSRTAALRCAAHEVFGDAGAEIFVTKIGIVSTNWKDERPLIFKNTQSQAHGMRSSFTPFFGCKVADAIIASCSAYPFFSRHTVKKSNGDIVELGDGGFCANNPTLYAIADATMALGHAEAYIRVLSVGVGNYPEPFRLTKWVPGVKFLQKILGTNTCSMEVLRSVLFKGVHTVRISEAFSGPEMATDLMEDDMEKLNVLAQKGRNSFATEEAEIKRLLSVS